jgi:hypothetical protein
VLGREKVSLMKVEIEKLKKIDDLSAQRKEGIWEKEKKEAREFLEV